MVEIGVEWKEMREVITMSDLVPSFKETLFDTTIDMSIDYLELGLDAVTDNEIIKQFPIVGSVVKLGKLAIAIRDRHLLKKTLEFIRTVNNGNIALPKIEKYKSELESNPKKMERELEHVLILLDNQIDGNKSRVLGHFFIAYINGFFDWEDFSIFSEILDRISIHDFPFLGEAYQQDYLHVSTANMLAILSIQRLNGLGLIRSPDTKFIIDNTINKNAQITELGKIFYSTGIEPDC